MENKVENPTRVLAYHKAQALDNNDLAQISGAGGGVVSDGTKVTYKLTGMIGNLDYVLDHCS